MNWFSSWQKDRLTRAAELPKDRFQYGLSISVDTPEIKEIFTLTESDTALDETLRPYLEKAITAIDSDYHFAAMAGGAPPEVHVFEKGQHEKTLTISSNTFSVVVAEADAEVSITAVMEGEGGAGHTIVVIAKDDATVDCEHITSGSGPFFINTVGVAEKDAWITVVERHEHPSFTKSHTTFFLGEHAEGKIDTRLRAENNNTYDISHGAVHEGSHSRAQLLSRGVAGLAGKIVYRGNIEIDKGVVGIQSHQDGKFLMLEEGAEIDAIPALDINSKDVVCSHAVSITYPREDLLYYTALRGFTQQSGRRLLIDSLLYA